MKLNGIAEKISRGKSVRVGFLEGAAPEPDGTSVATIAAYQEFGTKSIPARPFFRTMIQEQKSGWGAAFNALMQGANLDTAKALNLMGELMDGQLKQSIHDFSDPGLSAVTLLLHQRFPMRENMTFADVLQARRDVAAGIQPTSAHSNPLIWTGHMWGSVNHQVKSD